MWVVRTLALIAGLAAAPRAWAQAISPADYLPLSDGAQWQLDRVSGSGQSKLRLEVTDVNVTDTGTRYLIDMPVDDVHLGMRLEFVTDGSLVLRAVTIDLNELLADLPFDPGATGDLQFQPPVLLGTATLVPGSAVAETAVNTEFSAELDSDIGDVEVDVQVTGTVTSTWDPATSPTVTPAGSFDDVLSLALDIALRFSEDDFDSDETVEERIVFVLARSVGFVQFRSGDTTYALNRAVVNGVPIGNYAQYEDIVGLSFTVPPVISLDGRARGNASSGDFVLHDVRLSHALQGRAQIDAVLDHPAATGVPVSVSGPTTARKDGRLKLDLTGKTVVLDQKLKLHVKQIVDPTSTTLDLTAKIGGTSVVIPIGIEPVVSGDVRISLDGLVDQSTGSGGERTLTSDGRLLLGDVEYPIVAKEKLKTKKDGTRARTYKFKPTGNDSVVVQAEATSTSAADFTITKLKPTLFKLAVPKSQVSDVVPTVVEP
jgi:hypothetical protein